MRNDSFVLTILFRVRTQICLFPFRKICLLQCFSVQVSRMSTRAISAFIGDKRSAVPPVQVATIFLATTRACTDLFIAPLLSRDSHSVSPPPSSHLRSSLSASRAFSPLLRPTCLSLDRCCVFLLLPSFLSPLKPTRPPLSPLSNLVTTSSGSIAATRRQSSQESKSPPPPIPIQH